MVCACDLVWFCDLRFGFGFVCHIALVFCVWFGSGLVGLELVWLISFWTNVCAEGLVLGGVGIVVVLRVLVADLV